MKIVMLIKICLNETYSKACIGKNLSDKFPVQNGLKQGDCFITIAFKLCCRISVCHQEGPRKQGGTEIEQDTATSGLC